MKNTANRKLRIGTTLQVYKNDQMISSTTKQKKSQIFRAIEAISFTESKIKAFIRVSYGIGCNESEHCSKESLYNALQTYTEKKLIDFIYNEE